MIFMAITYHQEKSMIQESNKIEVNLMMARWSRENGALVLRDRKRVLRPGIALCSGPGYALSTC